MMKSTEQPAVAFVTAPLQTGGGRMRFDALCAAAERLVRLSRIELECDRNSSCSAGCRLDRRRSVSIETDRWWFDRAYCPLGAGELRKRFRAAGVRTIVFSGLDTYRYVQHFAGGQDTRVVFDMHNIEAELYSQIRADLRPDSSFYPQITGDFVDKIRQAERTAVAAADEIWVCSPADEALLRQVHPVKVSTPVTMVPNVLVVPADPPPLTAVGRIVFVGRLDYYPNVRAAETLVRKIVPLSEFARAQGEVVIAGADPRPEVESLDGLHGVRIVANPGSMREILHGSVLAVPLTLGGGSRLKILEAFAWGVPVVSTAKGMEGISAVDGTHYLRAESPSAFAAALDAVVADAKLRADLVTAAWHLAAERYSTTALRNGLRPFGRLSEAVASTE